MTEMSEEDDLTLEEREDCITGIISTFDEAAYNYMCGPYGEWDMEKIEEIMNREDTKIIESDYASARSLKYFFRYIVGKK